MHARMVKLGSERAQNVQVVRNFSGVSVQDDKFWGFKVESSNSDRSIGLQTKIAVRKHYLKRITFIIPSSNMIIDCVHQSTGTWS